MAASSKRKEYAEGTSWCSNCLSDETTLRSRRPRSESRDSLRAAAALAGIKSCKAFYLDDLKGCGCFGVTVSVSVFK